MPVRIRKRFPAEKLESYVDQYIAWSPDGTSIIANDEDPIRVMATVKSMGYKSADILVALVAPSDLVIIGGGEF